MDYAIVTDSSCNLSSEMIDELGLEILSLSYMDEQGNSKLGYEKGVKSDLKTFYDQMRDGKVFTTSLPKLEDSNKLMRSLLEEGRDILYIGFSSGLSGTCQATMLLMSDLQKEFPERKLVAIDTYAASMGQGLLVYYAVKMKNEGKSMDEVAKWVEDNKQKVAHWFTVEDLIYLFRGGRVSRTSAWAGNLLNIKPVLHVDEEGKLIPMEKVRGRKKSINALYSHFKETYVGVEACPVIMISHGDCIDDVHALEKMVRADYGDEVEIFVNYIDTVIGAHSGPGTLALFFLADHK